MNGTEPASRLSQRQRRTLQTAGLVLVAVVLGGAALVISSRERRPAQYTPGEANADITESLRRNLPPDAPAPKLVDVTREAGLADFVTFAGDRSSQLPEDMGPGAAWGDAASKHRTKGEVSAAGQARRPPACS